MQKNIIGIINGDYSVVTEYFTNVALGKYMWFVPCLISVEIFYAISKKLKVEKVIVWGG